MADKTTSEVTRAPLISAKGKMPPFEATWGFGLTVSRLPNSPDALYRKVRAQDGPPQSITLKK